MNWQGLLVVLAFAALSVIGVLARRWTRGFARRSADNFAKGITLGNSGSPVVERQVDSLSTVVQFAAGAAAVTAALTAAALPRWWRPSAPGQWQVDLAKGDPEPATLAVLEPHDGGTRLALHFTERLAGLPMNEPDWRKLRKVALAAAAEAGIAAHEAAGPRLVYTPKVDLTGLNPAQIGIAPHRWERPSA